MSEEQKDIIDVVDKERANFLQFVRSKVRSISEMDAEDIVADVIFNVYNKVDIQYHIENLLAYMYRALRNRIADHGRQRSAHISLDIRDETTGAALIDSIIDPEAYIEANLESKERSQRLYKALMELDDNHRAVWVATEIEGRSFKELVEKWDEPIGTLLSRKSRATKLLRSKLRNLKKEED